MHKLLLMAIFFCAVYCSSQEDPPVPPTPVPIAAQIRLTNGFDQTANLSLTIFDGEVPRISRSLTTGVHQIIHLPNGAATFYVQVAHEGLRSILFTDYVTLEVGKSYTYVVTSSTQGVLLEDTPEVFSLAASYVRLMSCLQGNDSILVEFNALSVSETAELRNGEYTDFFQIQPGEYSIFANGINATQFISNTSATTICLLGNGTTSTSIYEFGQHLRDQIPDRPLCYAGYTESNGFCNCYSGVYSDSYIMRCFNVAPNECFNRTVSKLDNDVVPFVNWQETQVYGDRLNMTIYSEVVSGFVRRTLIEMPNPLCNYINSPQYYRKTVSDCKDIYHLAIPFEECGFVKTSTPSDEFYKGTIIVKQIDHLVIGEWFQPRVIETSFPVSIRIPKTLAIYSYVQVYGPPNLELDAIFVGQSVNTQERSAYLAYMSVVPYPLKVQSAEAVDLPYGVLATIDIVDVNCTSAAPCLQRFDVQLSSSGCFISGGYRLAVTLSCRTQTGCPEELFINGTVYLESRIVAQSLCSEVSVDIDLIGTIQAFTNNDLSTEVYALYPGQSAYFRISAYSPRVSLSSITLKSVYYSGPNGYQFLLAEGNLSSVAEANDFAWGALDATHAWFSVDVTVSPPSSVEETLFKLNQGETAWHYFVAIVDVEWGDFSPYSAPVYQPAAAVKKRLVLQGPISHQGSQFNSRVQVTGPTLQPSNVSSAISIGATCLALVILAVALVM